VGKIDGYESTVEAGGQRPVVDVRLPWWFRVLVRVVLIALLAMPLTAGFARGGLDLFLTQLPPLLLVAVGLLHHRLLSAAAGVPVARNSFLAYPASRPATFAYLAVVVVGELVTVALVRHHANLAQPVAVILLSAVLASWCLSWQTAVVVREAVRR
jgi:hypothetical protein